MRWPTKAIARHGAQSGAQALEAIQRGEYDLPTRYWREGPVRYLLSQDEDVAFRALDSQQERERYIKRFWAARDPDPSTPGNPFRDLFYRRVAEANERTFAASTKPGWLTDRGKVFIILGPPDEHDAALLQAKLAGGCFVDLPRPARRQQRQPQLDHPVRP